jgi:hypothetical protein
MKGAIIRGARGVRHEERAEPKILESTAAEGHRAMDERRAIKTLLRV